MFKWFVFRLVAILLLVGGVIALANGAYNAGVSDGVASVGAAADGARTVVVNHGFGFGFFPGFFFFPIGFLLFFLLIGSLFRAARWGGRGYRGRGYGPYSGHAGMHGWGGNGSPLEDWHRQAHDQAAGQPGAPGTGTTTGGRMPPNSGGSGNPGGPGTAR